MVPSKSDMLIKYAHLHTRNWLVCSRNWIICQLPPHHPFQGRVSIKFCIVFKNYVVIKTSLKPSEMQYLRGKTSSQKIEIFTLTEPHVEKSNSKSIFKNVKLDKSRFGHLWTNFYKSIMKLGQNSETWYQDRIAQNFGLARKFNPPLCMPSAD